MKQRISVRIIVKDGDAILALRRANGRQSILGRYELPGGKLAYGEQPEDAVRRYLHDDCGLHIPGAKLFDAVTYIDHDDSSLQYVVIVYLADVTHVTHTISLSQNYDKYVWQNQKKIQQNDVTDLAQLLLGIIHQDEITDMIFDSDNNHDDKNTSDTHIFMYTDGGSRGNPGPSAAGYVMMNRNHQVVDQGGEYLGITTNNVAEYHGVRLGLERARDAGYTSIDFYIDSMLVVNQMNGVYKIKNRELWPVHEKIRSLMTHFGKVTFTHVPREDNQLADGMVNQILNMRRS